MVAPGVCGAEESGTWTIVLHCGQEARLPAALAGTRRARPQPEQWNSMESGDWVEGIRVLGMTNVENQMSKE